MVEQEYDFFPCGVCGQAVAVGGMEMHLAQLKPVLGLKLECEMCESVFIEQRALLQHVKFCRLKNELE